VYEVLSTGAAGLQDLQDLVGYLHGAGPAGGVAIDLLYAANPTAATGSGLRSDVVAASTVLLKANLSTLTHSPSRLRARGVLLQVESTAPDILADASLADPVGFLTLLWECGVVNSGGYYLFYQTGGAGGGQGLPPSLFNQSPSAILSVLVTVRPTQGGPTIAPAAFHNTLVLAQNLPAADSSVFVTGPTYTVRPGDTLASIAAALGITAQALGEANATTPNLLQPGTALTVGGHAYTVQPGDDVLDVALATGATVDAVVAALSGAAGALTAGAVIQVDPAWVALGSTLPPGSAGFRLLRTDPDPDASNPAVANEALGAQADPATALQVLYNLVGYWLNAEGGFVESPEGLPTGPTTDRNQAPNAALRVTASGTPPWSYQRVLSIAQYAAQQPAPGPVPGQDPYAGLGTSAQLGLEYYDLYGNRCLPADAVGPLDVGVLYRDPIFGLGQWPGVTASFAFTGQAGAAALQVVLGFDPTRYVPSGATPLATVLQRAQGDQARYAEIYFQFAQTDVQAVVETTLDKEASHALDRSVLLDLAVAAYRYLGSVQELQAVTATVQQGDTLQSIADAHRVTPGLVAQANQGSTDLLLAGATLSVPVLYVVLQNDTPELIGARSSLTPTAVAAGNPDAPLQPGTHLAFGAVSTVKTGDTLASLAAARGVPVAAVGGANASTPYVLAPGATLYLPGGIWVYTVQADDSLQSIADRFVTPVQSLAALNASVSGLLRVGAVVSAGGGSYTVKAADTLATVAAQLGLSVSALVQSVATDSGLLQPGAQLTTPIVPYVVVAGDTLGSIADAQRLTVETVAEQGASMAGLLQAGASVLLPRTVTVAEGDTLQSIASAQRVSVWDVGESAAAVAGLLVAGTSIPLAAGGSYVVQSGDTLDTVAASLGVSLAEVSTDAATVAGLLRAGAVVPVYLYTIQPKDTLSGVAAKLGVDAGALLETNADVANVFAAGITLHVGSREHLVAAGDTLSAIAAAGNVSVEQLAAGITGAGVLAPGASVAVPGHATLGSGATSTYTVKAGDTLQSIAADNTISLAVLGTASQELDGVLTAGVQVGYPGLAPETVQDGDTLATVLLRFQAQEGGSDATLAELLTANQTLPGLLVVGARLLLPPALQTSSVSVTPSFPGVIFPVTAQVVVTRSASLVDPAFADVPGVQSTLSDLRPYLQASGGAGDGDASTLGLQAFAASFEQAFPQLKLGTGGGGASGRKLLAVQLGIEKTGTGPLGYAIRPAPYFFAPRPLSRIPWSTGSTPIPIRAYANGSLTGEPRATQFTGIDLDTWGRGFLAAVDRFLTPEYAIPAFQLAPDAYRSVLAAKDTLAQAIRGQVGRVLLMYYAVQPGDTLGSIAAAKGTTAADLGQANADVAVLLAPGDTVTAGGHSYTVQTGDTLGTIAAALGSTVGAVAVAASGATLQANTVVGIPGDDDIESARETLYQQLLVTLSSAYTVDTIVQFRVDTTSPFTDPNTAPRLAMKTVGESYSIPAGATLTSVAAHFDVPVTVLAKVAADYPFILKQGTVVDFGGKRHTVQRTDTLASVAQALDTAVEPLAQAVADQAGLLQEGAGLNLVMQEYVTTGDDTLRSILDYFLPTGVELGPESPEMARFLALNGTAEGLLLPGAQLVQDTYVVGPEDTLDSIARSVLTTAAVLGSANALLPDLLVAGSGITVGGAPYTVAPGNTLQGIAHTLGVATERVIAAVEATPGLLTSGAVLSLQRTYTIGSGDTLDTIAAAEGVSTQSLGNANATTAGLLRPGTRITVGSASYTVASGDTLQRVANSLGVTVESLVEAIAGVADDLQQGGEMTVPFRVHTVQSSDTLDTVAGAFNVTPWELVEEQIDAPGIIASGATARFLSVLPGFSLSDARVALVDAAGAKNVPSLTFLFQMASATEYSHVNLELSFEINELEYDIHDVPWADGYQASEWISLVIPATDSSVGSVDIPVPLRAYPTPPSVLKQSTQPLKLGPNPTLQQIETFDFTFAYEYQRAAQDQVFPAFSTNLWNGTLPAALFGTGSSLPAALAQYQAVAVPLGQDLGSLPFLMQPGNQALRPVATAAVETLAQLAQQVAAGWAAWTTPPAARQPEFLYRLRELRTRRDERRVTLVPVSQAARAAETASTVSLAGREPAGPARGTAVRTFAFVGGASDGPASGDVFEHDVPNLSVLQVQNAWGSVQVTRNADLVTSQGSTRWITSTDFIYQVGPVGYPSPAAPLLTYSNPFPMASTSGEAEPSTLADHLISFFGALLQVTASSPANQGRNLRAAVSYGFFLAGTDSSDAIVTRVPVTMVPNFLFDPTQDLTGPTGFCNQLAGTLTTWLKSNDPPKQGGMWIFDVSLYTTPPAGTEGVNQLPPLLEMNNVQLPLADVAPS